MSQASVERLARRALVLGMTGAVLGVAATTVEAAAQQSRSTAAPLGTANLSAATINDQMAAEASRASTLSSDIDQVARQLADVRSAIGEANGALTTQNSSAAAVQSQLSSAKQKLTTVQSQLQAAQQRLAQLNAAAAKQAALNAAATKKHVSVVVTKTAASGHGGTGDD